MSDTPRTDVAQHNMGSVVEPHYVVDVEVAQGLERELAEAKEQLRLCNVDQFTTAAELAEAQEELNDRRKFSYAVELALEGFKGDYIEIIKEFVVAKKSAESAIKESLTVAEPVGWLHWLTVDGERFPQLTLMPRTDKDEPLYTAPPRREWVGLTDDDKTEIKKLVTYDQFETAGEYANRVQAATESKLKDKNGG
jgi:hypothetical protein